jgi:hypothetical protein
MIGAHELLVSYSDGAVTKTTTLTINVELTAVQLIVAGAIGLMVVGVIIAIPSLRKNFIKKTKKVVKKKSSTKKRKTKKK